MKLLQLTLFLEHELTFSNCQVLMGIHTQVGMSPKALHSSSIEALGCGHAIPRGGTQGKMQLCKRGN